MDENRKYETRKREERWNKRKKGKEGVLNKERYEPRKRGDLREEV